MEGKKLKLSERKKRREIIQSKVKQEQLEKFLPPNPKLSINIPQYSAGFEADSVKAKSVDEEGDLLANYQNARHFCEAIEEENKSVREEIKLEEKNEVEETEWDTKFKKQLDKFLLTHIHDSNKSEVKSDSQVIAAEDTEPKETLDAKTEAALARIVFYNALQKRRLLGKAFQRWRFYLLAPHPNTVVYATFDQPQQLDNPLDLSALKKDRLASILNMAAKAQTRNLFYRFNMWRYYCQFARNIDPTLYNTTRSIVAHGDLLAAVKESSLVACKTQKLKSLSAGSRVLEAVFKKKLRKGWEKILKEAAEEGSKWKMKSQIRKIKAIRSIIEIKERGVRNELRRWRDIVEEYKQKEDEVKRKLKRMCEYLKSTVKINLLKALSVWRAQMPPREPLAQSIQSEVASENIVEEEDLGILKPNSSAKLNPLLFESAIESNANRIFNLLKSHTTNGRTEYDGREAEMRGIISDLCVDMAIDFLNTCLNH